jgi:hypothetical protein
VVVLGLALYVMLKSVDRNLALLALLLKSMEAVLWAVIALGHLAALLVLIGGTPSTALEPGQVQALVGLLLSVHVPVTAVPGVFLGLNLVVFLYLLLKSKYVPGMLAGFGIVSYALIFIYDLTMIVAPSYSTMTAIQIVGWGPSVLFEMAIGSWLLIKGIAVPQRDDHAPAAPMTG